MVLTECFIVFPCWRLNTFNQRKCIHYSYLCKSIVFFNPKMDVIAVVPDVFVRVRSSRKDLHLKMNQEMTPSCDELQAFVEEAFKPDRR